MWSMNRLVNHMKLLPQLNRIDSTVATTSAHFTGPLTIKIPRMKRNSTKAPTYTGPEVPGCSPQYEPNWATYCRLLAGTFLMAALWLLRGMFDAPPLTSGISREKVSPMP